MWRHSHDNPTGLRVVGSKPGHITYGSHRPAPEFQQTMAILFHEELCDHSIFETLSSDDKMLMLDMMANTDCSYETALMGFAIWNMATTEDNERCFEDGPEPRSLKVGYYMRTDPCCPNWLATLLHRG